LLVGVMPVSLHLKTPLRDDPSGVGLGEGD
jgi:hypothetical protein